MEFPWRDATSSRVVGERETLTEPMAVEEMTHWLWVMSRQSEMFFLDFTSSHAASFVACKQVGLFPDGLDNYFSTNVELNNKKD